jgi:hypothetical protein
MSVAVTLEEALQVADEAVRRANWDVRSVVKPLRIVYLVGQLEFEVTLGGVHGWLVNTSGKYAVDATQALDEIGAHDCARIVRRILAFLPESPSPEDIVRSQQVEQALPAAGAAWRRLAGELLNWPDDVDRLLRVHVSNHEAEFRQASIGLSRRSG